MKILLSSYVFSPSIGGIETVSALLAPEFVKAGHEVVLVTTTAKDDGRTWPFEVVRNPSPARLIKLVRWCDLYFQNNISLLFAWPLLFIRRPWVIAHHTWIGRFQNHHDWKGQLKRWLLKYGSNATISRPVARDIPVPSSIVGNPYSREVFKARPDIPRDLELVYLGRLVSDKGVDMVIQSLVELRRRGISPRLAIIGSGPEEKMLRRLARINDVERQVEFMGSKAPDEIARVLNAHQVLVVPSRWPEPFGIVALEGIASGCVVVASDAGGLPDVVGSCGLTFPMNDQTALTESLFRLLTDQELRTRLLRDASAHLRQFDPTIVARKYMRVFDEALAAAAKP